MKTIITISTAAAISSLIWCWGVTPRSLDYSTRYLGNGFFSHRAATVDCRDGYTTDLCCELLSDLEQGNF